MRLFENVKEDDNLVLVFFKIKGSMKISMINIIVSAFVLSVCGFFGTFYYLLHP